MTTIINIGGQSARNENSDVQGKYSNTHFRISRNGYDGSGKTEWNEHNKTSFINEVRGIFTAHGWLWTESERSCVSPTATKGRSSLYLHPQDFSGVCENSEREALFDAFQKANSFLCNTVDVYAEIHDMSDEQLAELLRSKKDVIESELLEVFSTKRSNLYISDIGFFGADGKVSKRHSIRRLAIDGQKSAGGQDCRTEGLCHEFVSGIFMELVDKGRIITAPTRSGTGYRTVKNNERKHKTLGGLAYGSQN